MCLAVPGKVVEMAQADSHAVFRSAKVELNGTLIEVNLVLTPDARPGDYVLVHAGHGIEIVSRDEAEEIWSYLRT